LTLLGFFNKEMVKLVFKNERFESRNENIERLVKFLLISVHMYSSLLTLFSIIMLTNEILY